MLDDQRVDVVVQWVRTSWTKRSRGGTQAARRNVVPTAFPLPIMRTPFVHEVLTDEHDDFQPHSTTHDGLPDSDDDLGVSLREAAGLLRIELVVTPFGMPRRWRRHPAVHLTHGQWLRWQVNYRFTDPNGEWRYRLDTLNISHGQAPTDQFLGTPTHYVNELAILR